MSDPFAHLRRAQGDSAVASAAALLLKSMDEAIKQKDTSKLDPTVVYFGLLMTYLDGEAAERQAKKFGACVYLLGHLLPQVPSGPVHRFVDTIAEALLEVMQQLGPRNTDVLRACLLCGARLLCHLTPRMWKQRENGQKLLRSILYFAVDSRPKVRQDARRGLELVLSEASMQLIAGRDHTVSDGAARVPSTVAETVADYALRQLHGTTLGDAVSTLTATLTMSSILMASLHLLSVESQHALLQAVLALLTQAQQARKERTADRSLRLSIFRLLNRFFDSMTGEHELAQLVLQETLTRRPNLRADAEIGAWLNAVSAGAARCEIGVACRVTRECAQVMLSDYSQADAVRAVTVASDALRHVLRGVFSEERKRLLFPLLKESGRSWAHELVDMLRSMMTLKHRSLWSQALQVIGATCSHLGRNESLEQDELIGNLLKPLLDELLALYGSEHCTQHGEIRKALAGVCRTLRLPTVLRVLPLHVRPVLEAPDAASFAQALKQCNDWLLDVIADNPRARQSLLFWTENMLPLATGLQELAQRVDNQSAARSASGLSRKVWRTLTAVAEAPVGISEALPTLLPALTSALEVPSARGSVCQFLASFGDHAVAYNSIGEGSLEGVLPVGKVVLPALFAVLGTVSQNDGAARQPLLHAVQQMALACRKAVDASTESVDDVVSTLFRAAATKQLREQRDLPQQLSSARSPAEKSWRHKQHLARVHVLMDVCAHLAPALTAADADLLWRVVAPALQRSEDGGEEVELRHAGDVCQKKALVTLRALCIAGDGFVQRHKTEVAQALESTAASTAPTAKKQRFRALRAFLASLDMSEIADETLLLRFLGELLIARREQSKATRANAADALLVVAENAYNSGRIVQLLQAMSAGLAGASTLMQAATVDALGDVFVSCDGVIDAEVQVALLKTVFAKMRQTSRDVVTSTMDFAKKVVRLVDKTQVLLPVLPDLLQGMLFWCDEADNPFRLPLRNLLAKLMRIVGDEEIARTWPERHSRLLRYVRKEESRRRKTRADEEAAKKSSSKEAQTFEDILHADSDDEENEDMRVVLDDEAETDLQDGGLRVFKSSSAVGQKRRRQALPTVQGKLLVSENTSQSVLGRRSREDETPDPEQNVRPALGHEEDALRARKRARTTARQQRRQQKQTPGDGSALHITAVAPSIMNKRHRREAKSRFGGLVRAAQKGALQGRRAGVRDRVKRR
ncbi:MAG: hypothetical protein MHM6MM_001910 [Cercozoa sp. M6MM]